MIKKSVISRNKIDSKESMYANWWAIQNILPLSHKNKRWLTVSYENLYLNPKYELDRISKYLDIDMSRFSLENIKKPSSTTKEGSAILENKNQLANFKKFLNGKQIDEILEIIHSYGINCYDEGLEPNYKNLNYE